MFVIALRREHYTEPIRFYLKNSGCLVDHMRYHRNLDSVEQMIYFGKSAFLGKILQSFLMTDITFCALEIFSLLCLLKSTF